MTLREYIEQNGKPDYIFFNCDKKFIRPNLQNIPIALLDFEVLMNETDISLPKVIHIQGMIHYTQLCDFYHLLPQNFHLVTREGVFCNIDRRKDEVPSCMLRDEVVEISVHTDGQLVLKLW